ncbi:TIGR04255 family protein [Burkholderia multivorans]|nr:TIGR04255 family protein [Burkholderia multivorans]AYY97670.1 TIGR04255 family protein [Burkholderia multivorans]PRF47947.1 hypothetical protein C6Q04_14825 [Burkholderia multivorans]PRG12638.1 hypothetical protein C6Q21_07395 [Burkholderia multivorans]PRG46351.1 hypothetical protein C6T63_28860 [Burkholderia multivorans]
MAIGIEWAVPLTETQLEELRNVYEGAPEIKEFLPQYAPVQAFSIQQVTHVGPSSPPVNLLKAPQVVTQAAGFDLRRFDPSGKVLWVTSARPQVLSCNCSDYDRWKNVKPKALSLLRPFVDAALKAGAQIKAIGLQYQDAFKLPGGISPEVTGQLFRRDSRWIPDHMFEEPSYWHCHQGWFSKGPDQRRVLNNITTDISDINGACFARIGGQHRVFATSFDAKSEHALVASDIDRVLDCLHDENKTVINGMLSDIALESIGCTARGTS